MLATDQSGPFVECLISGKPVSCLVDTGASRSTLKAAEFPFLPYSPETVNAVGIGGQPIPHPVSEPVSISIGPLSENHAFLLSPCAPVNLLGKDLLCKLGCVIYCSPDGVYLEVPEHRETELVALLTQEYSDSDTSFLQEELLARVPPQLWSTHANEVGHMLSAEPVRIILNPAKPLPRVPQYPISKEAEEGIKPVVSSLLEQGIIVPIRSPCNTPILPVKKPGKDTYRFVQDLRAVNAAVLPAFPWSLTLPLFFPVSLQMLHISQ